MTAPKYKQVATRIRTQIGAGLLVPGEAAPSGAALARVTGYSQLTCRKALHTLIREGVLVPGASPGARPRVPVRGPTPGEQTLASAARALSASLASRRRAAGMTQPQLAALTGMSVTSIGHAETGRLWQSRRFWELADKGVGAGGEVLALHDAYRAAAVPADSPTAPGDTEAEASADNLPAVAVAASVPVAAVSITWADGTVTTVHSP
jgi:DNA-binding XRE family transcriptional regulator